MSKRLLEGKKLLQDAIEVLESPKGTVLSGIQKLNRASALLENDELYIWSAIQLGDSRYCALLEDFKRAYIQYVNDKSAKHLERLDEIKNEVQEWGIDPRLVLNDDEMNRKINESYGGLMGIGFIEEKYNDLKKRKRGHDGKFYKTNLHDHIEYIRRKGHTLASSCLTEISYKEAPQTAFDIIRTQVDDNLLDIAPELAEQLMLAFQSVTKNSTEDWSHALTSCRRFIENLADIVYPPKEGLVNNRKVGRSQYLNRIWAFMDESISSSSNKELAKSHVDVVGNMLASIHKLTNKGVHTEVSRLEAVKTVFHLYLLVADFIEFISEEEAPTRNSINIQTATLDELESLLDISRKVAKEIVKMRISEDEITLEILGTINGIGPKKLKKAAEIFGLDK